MFCTKCGANNSDTAVYCQKCGTLLEAEEETRLARPMSVKVNDNDDEEAQIFSIRPTLIRVSKKEAKEFEKIESAALTVYEPNVLTIRTSDGKLRLVNQ